MVWRINNSVDEFILLGLTSNPQIQLILFPIFSVIYLITLMGNSLIILVTITENSLQTPMYFFLTNLSFIDISYSSAIVPRMLKDLLSLRKTISFGQCAGQMYIGASLAYTEFILLPIMAYDRYIAICYPLYYTTIMNRIVCVRIVFITWVGGFVLPIFLITFVFRLPMCDRNEINHFVCELPEVIVLACTDLFTIQYSIFVLGTMLVMIPVTFILISYMKIIATILKMTSAAGRRKTFSTCASHIIVVTLFYSTIAATYIKPTSIYSQEEDKMIAVVYTVLTPMLNPLIYTLRNKEVKAAFTNIRKKLYIFSNVLP
ncbi:olfactory receptor 1013-like [Bombina bombina]|uniref:olfactory receptor 1013-like n=1 Tax=Bombina bombina TaxID=8345 RepID=UPI00235B2015|nr:olfactory receptor 1013-like [Bombina bombina]